MATVTSLDDFPAVARVSTEDLFRSLPRPIAVVGNGPIRNSHGAFIDQHATVIRFNNFRLQGCESKVGTKVTHWCMNGVADGSATRSFWLRWAHRLLERQRNPGVQLNPHVDERVVVFTPRAFDYVLMANSRWLLGIEPHFVADASLLYALQAEIPFPTVGFTTLYLLHKFQPEIDVFGFSGLKGGHYWNPSHHHTRRHLDTAQRELDLIRSTPGIRIHE